MPACTWLKQTFTEADKNGDGTLSISEVLQLLHKLNVNLPRQKVKQMFKEADTDDNQGTLDFEEFCSFYKMMSTRRDLYLLMLTYSNHKDHMDADDITRFLEIEQKMTKVTKDHCLEIINKFDPCSQNQKQGVLGIDGVLVDGLDDVLEEDLGGECVAVVDDGLAVLTVPAVHRHPACSTQVYMSTRDWDMSWSPISYPVILSIENHCSVPQQKKMAEYLSEILGDKLDLSNVKAHESGHLPSPESLRGKILVKVKIVVQIKIPVRGKKLPPNIDEDADEGDVSDEDSADEMEDDCKLMNGDTSANRKQVESLAKKKLDSLMKESKIRDREDPDSFTIAALPPRGSPPRTRPASSKGDEGTDTADESNSSGNKRGGGRSFMGSFSKRKKKASKLKRTSSLEDTDTDQESFQQRLQSPAAPQQVSSLSETKAHQVMMQKAAAFIHFNQRQLSRIYPSGSELPVRGPRAPAEPGQVLHSNGNCGYILKPACMCDGAFNPHLEDPLPGQMKKQLVLKIISGQQLPKPKDSMLGDRGEAMVRWPMKSCPMGSWSHTRKRTRASSGMCRVNTRVSSHMGLNPEGGGGGAGFNPMWEETLVFTLHMPELALVRFLVWDHDPIGQDFIGQRTIAFNSMMTGQGGQRHKRAFSTETQSRLPWTAMLLLSLATSTHSRAHQGPAQRSKKGLPDIAIDTKDYSSEGRQRGPRVRGAGRWRGGLARPPRFPHPSSSCNSSSSITTGRPTTSRQTPPTGSPPGGMVKVRACAFARHCPMSEPLKRVTRLRQQEPLDPGGCSTRVWHLGGRGRVGVSSNCITCVVGTKESPEAERKGSAEEAQAEHDGAEEKPPTLSLNPVSRILWPNYSPYRLDPTPKTLSLPPPEVSTRGPGFHFTPGLLFGPAPFVPFTRCWTGPAKTLCRRSLAGGAWTRLEEDCSRGFRAPPGASQQPCYSGSGLPRSHWQRLQQLQQRLGQLGTACVSWSPPPCSRRAPSFDSRKRAAGTLAAAELRDDQSQCVFAEPRPAAPLPHLTPLPREEALDHRALRHSISTRQRPAHHHHSSAGLVADTHRGHLKRPLAPLSRTVSSPGTLLLTQGPTLPSVLPQCGQDPWVAATSTSYSTSPASTNDPKAGPNGQPQEGGWRPRPGVSPVFPACHSKLRRARRSKDLG
ncbi:hypothetical protein CRUP_038488 [Coryphaenoides rupestris]|nr:hypothetical protein CRUP_038488 [Coryphaenoides rupestris]